MEQEYLDITYLPQNGFERKKCPECGKYYWTAGGHEICNDPPCGSYTFIGNPLFNQKFDLTEMREKFLSFFEKRDHPRIERYPVVARWRDDIYLTIASIADFQPFVTSGVVPPPANPLTISQPCIRMDDLDSVGRTGRHLTIFEMMAHHAFNSSQREIYWKNKTAALCTELLNELGVPTKDIIYKEEPWAGGGNAGPCLEAIVGGLELSTLVFMNMIKDPQGGIEIKGERYRKMDNYIVDTGYGLERFVWASQGTPTVYDAIFPQVLEQILANSNIEFDVNDEKVKQIIGESSKIAGVMGELRGKALQDLRHNVANKLGLDLKEIEEVVLPLEKVYALADHTRTILFMLGDGLIPSNAGGGYLARLMIRRALRLAEELEFNGKLYELVDIHRRICGMDFETPETTIEEILDLEQDRYTSTVIKGTSMIKRTLSRKKKIEKEDFIEFYDSHGIPAEVAMKIAEEKGVEVEYPEDFYSQLASKHVQADEKTEEKEVHVEGTYPQTEKLYYDSSVLDFQANVVGREDGKVFLDKTAFYPESGGQDNDTGYLVFDGKEVPVVDVLEENGMVVHCIKGELGEEVKEGAQVKGVVDKRRRLRHMRHHSATHILLYALQQVLGKHVWQSGARKEWDRARLDVTHYQRPDEEQIRKIELLANREVMANKPVTWDWMDRLKAEEKYGFRLYQGGVPAGEKIRVMRVGDDVQACGGTHVHYTGDIGVIKILRVDSIQDGVIRFEYAAGEAALEHIAYEEDLLKEASGILRVEPSQLPKSASRFFEEWKEQKKEIERLTEEIANSKAQLLAEEAETHNSVKVVAHVFEDAEMQELVKVGRKLAEQNFVGVLATTRNGVKVVTFSGLNEVDSRDMIKEVGKHIKGSGGGKPDLSQGAGQIPPTRDQLVDIIFEFLGQQKRSS